MIYTCDWKQFQLETDTEKEITFDLMHRVLKILRKSQTVKYSICQRTYGKTASFRIIFLDMTRDQQCIQTTAQKNNLDLKVFALNYFLLLYLL